MYEIGNRCTSCADPEGGGGTGGPDPPEKSQKYRVSYQYRSGSPENHKAAKSAYNGGPLSARQRYAIEMAFRWRADDGPLMLVFGSSLPLSTKKNVKKLDPL